MRRRSRPDITDYFGIILCIHRFLFIHNTHPDITTNTRVYIDVYRQRYTSKASDVNKRCTCFICVQLAPSGGEMSLRGRLYRADEKWIRTHF